MKSISKAAKMLPEEAATFIAPAQYLETYFVEMLSQVAYCFLFSFIASMLQGSIS